jgi:acylphosphatase
MKRANIRIKGNVQMAGFRTFVKNTADSLNVKGFAENQEDGSVKVVCEGEEERITRLINSIKESPPSFASIEEMNVAYEEHKGEFTGFECRGADVPQKATLDDLLRVLKSSDSKAERLVSFLSDTNVTLKSVKEDTSSIKEDTKLIPRA